MKASGTSYERETIINFNDESSDCEIWTASDTVYRRLLKRLGRTHLVEEGERHAVFRFPGKWLILPRHREPKPLTPSQIARLEKMRAKALANKKPTGAKSGFEEPQ